METILWAETEKRKNGKLKVEQGLRIARLETIFHDKFWRKKKEKLKSASDDNESAEKIVKEKEK